MKHFFSARALGYAVLVALTGGTSCLPEQADPTTASLTEIARITVAGHLPVVLTADLDRDQLEELIIADPSAGAYPRTEAGEIRLLDSPVASGEWTELPARLIVRGSEPFRHLGTGLQSADLDGDSHGDLVICADASPAGEGMVWVVSGARRGDHPIDSIAFLTLTGPSTLGQALAVLDYNNDGFDDLAVTCPLRSAVYVVFGPRSGIVRLPDQADAVVFSGSGSLGWTAAGGDFDADGQPELALADPVSDTVYVVPCGMTGENLVTDVASAILRSSDAVDHLTGAEVLPGDPGQPDGLAIRSRRFTSEQTGTLFVLRGRVSGETDIAGDARLTLRDVAVSYGVSATLWRPAFADKGTLVVGTPGQSQIPDSNLKGGLWLVSPDSHGQIGLHPTEAPPGVACLRAQDAGLDWLGASVASARIFSADAENLVVAAKGAVLIYSVP